MILIYKQRFDVWWQDLSLRERRILMLGGLFLALFLPYIAIWQPLHERLAAMHSVLERQRIDLAWMLQASEEIKVLQGRSQASPQGSMATGQSLLGLVDSTARTGDMAGTIRRIQPEGQATVRVWLENAPFDALLRWLDLLQQQYGIRINGVVVDRQTQPGLVSARIVLEGGGS